MGAVRKVSAVKGSDPGGTRARTSRARRLEARVGKRLAGEQVERRRVVEEGDGQVLRPIGPHEERQGEPRDGPEKRTQRPAPATEAGAGNPEEDEEGRERRGEMEEAVEEGGGEGEARMQLPRAGGEPGEDERHGQVGGPREVVAESEEGRDRQRS